jgi:predicted ATPase/DNA-binding CsgD family transcriptional regulator
MNRLADAQMPADLDLPRSRAPGHELPDQLTSFVGRERELEKVRELLDATRLLTLTGAGGCGKTRLAREVAGGTLERFPDGAWWVELAPLGDPALVGQAVADTLGVRPLPGYTALEAAVMHLSARCALVVLDNCEHLLDQAAECVEALLHGCQHVTLLATSRAPLGTGAETTWRVPPLSLPAEPAPESVDGLLQSDAVQLFIERALKVHPEFGLTDDRLPVVARICTELDGIPLAIELAAARTRMLSLEQIAEGLADRFRLLTGGARGALARHQTLRGSVDWSHDQLSEDERTLLRRLGVFRGGFTLEACEQVGAGDGLDRSAILDLLGSLVDKSLVLAQHQEAAVRYRLLETVRQYALERAAAAGEANVMRDRHRDVFLDLAERAEPELTTPRQHEWLALLDPEAANLAAAVDWAIESDPERALRLCVALTFWRRLRGRFAESDVTYARALEAADEEPSSLRASALRARAWLKAMAADFIGSVKSAEEALAMAEEVGDDSTAARALDVLGLVELFRDPIRSRPLLERSRELAERAGDYWCWIDATMILGSTYWLAGEHETALELYDEALPLIERHGHREFLALQWFDRGGVEWQRGDLPRAREFLERSIALSREVGEPVYEPWAITICAWIEADRGNGASALELLGAARDLAVTNGIGWALRLLERCGGYTHAALGELGKAQARLEADVAHGASQGGAWLQDCWALRLLAEVLWLAGDAERAQTCAEEALETAERVESSWHQAMAKLVLAGLAVDGRAWTEAETLAHEALDPITAGGFRPDVPRALDLLAEVAVGLDSHEEAARLLGAAARCRNELGVVRWVPHEERVAVLEERLHDAIGDEEFERAFEEGRNLETDQAVAWVRRTRGSRKRPPGGWESLTPTELDVVQLATEGLTNPEIGERMFISRHTVKVHLSHVYAKIGVKNRSELAAEATRRGHRVAR